MIKRKAAFDHKVLRTNAGEVIFTEDQLVQVYDNSLDTTLSTTCKLLPQWSAPRRIVQRGGNSYMLKTLEGFPVLGWFHTRHLHEFIPCLNTNQAITEEERSAGRRGREDKPEESKARDVSSAISSWPYSNLAPLVCTYDNRTSILST